MNDFWPCPKMVHHSLHLIAKHSACCLREGGDSPSPFTMCDANIGVYTEGELNRLPFKEKEKISNNVGA